MRLVSLSAALLAVFVVACANAPSGVTREGGLTREGAEGPYVAGTTEVFSLDVAAGTQVRWFATAGALSASQARVRWTLPEGLSTLTATLTAPDGQVTNREWSFQVEPPVRVGHTTAREALLGAPIQVVDGGVETSGNGCDLQYDGTGNVHLVFTTSTHPSIFYGRWNGSTWSIEFVDGLGFNTGARIEDSRVALAVESNGTPHLVYVRNTPSGQLWYATKSGATWVRERIDSDTVRLFDSTYRFALALNPAQSNRPYAVFTSLFGTSQQRIAVSQRTAVGTWSPVQLTTTVTGATSYERLVGDAVFVGGTLVFPVIASGSTTYAFFGWTGTGTTFVPSLANSPGFDTSDVDLAVASASRVVARTRQGVFDLTVGAPFSSSTMTWSASTISGASEGDVAWTGGRPVVMQNLNGSLELATPNAEGYWTWTALSTASGNTAALALHPTTGAASICYQAGGRVMFQ